MRLHACLLLACACVAITVAIPISDEHLTQYPEDSNRPSESHYSQHELINHPTIKDPGNQLRSKPEDIPVDVLVEQVQPALKAGSDEEKDEEIVRPEPDLKHPGQPQRQEHETQNPTSYSAEQNSVLKFKQTINEAETFLRQGFKDVSEGIQHAFESNEQFKSIQENIQSLQQGFVDQMNKLNGTIQDILYPSNGNEIAAPGQEQIKENFLNIESGLKTLKTDFNKGIETFSEGVKSAANLRDETQTSTENKPEGSTTEASTNFFQQILNSFQQSYTNTMSQLQNYTTNIQQNWNIPFLQPQPPTEAPAGDTSTSNSDGAAVQSDVVPVAPTTARPTGPLQVLSDAISNVIPQRQPGQLGSGSGPFYQLTQAVTGAFNAFRPAQQPAVITPEQQVSADQKPSEPQTVNKPESRPELPALKPEQNEKPATQSIPEQAAAVTPAGPIRQILQKNPISQGIASAVQRLTNIRNPEKPRDDLKTEEQKPSAAVLKVEEKPEAEPEKKGHLFALGPHGGGGGGEGHGDNNDVSGSRVDDAKDQKQAPEEQKKEEQTEKVVEKTE